MSLSAPLPERRAGVLPGIAETPRLCPFHLIDWCRIA